MTKEKKTSTTHLGIPEGLQIFRYRFLFRVVSPVLIPENHYPPDSLNGAFGQTLMKRVCLMPLRPGQAPCKSCMLRMQCSFPFLMAEKGLAPRTLPRKYSDHPKPWVISAPEMKHQYAVNENLSFDMTLIGSANQRLNDILFAMMLAGEAGIGTHIHHYRNAWKGGSLQLQWMSAMYDQETLVPLFVNGCLTEGVEPRPWPLITRDPSRKRNRLTGINLLSPLCLPEKNAADFSLNHLVKLAANRISLLSYLYCGTELPEKEIRMPEEEMIEPIEKITHDNTYLTSSRKFSNDYPVKGITGVLTFDGRIAPYLNLLRLGGMLHTGSGSSNSFGYFRIE